MKGKWFRVVVAGAVVASAAVCQAAGSGFPTWRGDPSLAGTVEIVPDDPVRIWQFPAGAPVTVAPVIGDGMVFVVNNRGEAFGLDKAGTKKWSKKFVAPSLDTNGPALPLSFTAPVCHEKTLVLVSNDGDVLGVRTSDGETVWRTSVGGNVQGSPNIVSNVGKAGWGVVVLSQAEGFVTCLDAKDGSAIWKTDPFARADGTLAVAGDRIAFGACDATIHVLSTKDGAEVASIGLGEGNEVAGGVALSSNMVFSGSRSGALHAADTKQKSVKWTTGGGGELFTTPAADGEYVVYGAGNGTVYAVRRADGKAAWEFDTKGMQAGSPLIAGKRIVATADGNVFILDRDTGKKIWSKSSGDALAPPAVADGVLVVASDDGTVSAYGKKESKP
jgi:outer membrane protein assembly factor BamB